MDDVGGAGVEASPTGDDSDILADEFDDLADDDTGACVVMTVAGADIFDAPTVSTSAALALRACMPITVVVDMLLPSVVDRSRSGVVASRLPLLAVGSGLTVTSGVADMAVRVGEGSCCCGDDDPSEAFADVVPPTETDG